MVLEVVVLTWDPPWSHTKRVGNCFLPAILPHLVAHRPNPRVTVALRSGVFTCRDPPAVTSAGPGGLPTALQTFRQAILAADPCWLFLESCHVTLVHPLGVMRDSRKRRMLDNP